MWLRGFPCCDLPEEWASIKSSHFFTQNTWDLVKKKINGHAPPPKKEPKEKIENKHTEPDGLIISYQ